MVSASSGGNPGENTKRVAMSGTAFILARSGFRTSVAVCALSLSLLAVGRPAQALPSYAAQTDQPCTACHVGSFGPQLTPTGRAFKIGGYTQSGGEGWR